MSDIRTVLLQTVAFFDCMQRPVLFSELEYICAPFGDRVHTHDALATLLEQQTLTKEHGGYIAVPRHQYDIDSYRDRASLHDALLHIAVRATRMLRYVPGLRSVWLCNSVAFDAMREDSDIDVVIVAKKELLWSVRLCSHIILKLLKLRTGARAHARKICLSFFLTEEGFDCSSFALPNDVYLRYWMLFCLPVYDPEKLIKQFRKSNMVLLGSLNDSPLCESAPLYRVALPAPRLRAYIEYKLCWLRFEHVARVFQIALLRRRGLFSKTGLGIRISDTMIKLHEQDRREWYREEWQKRCSLLGVSSRLAE